MDIKQYFEEIRKEIANLTDDEFNQLLVEAGIESCPFEDEVVFQHLEYSNKRAVYYSGKYYSCSNQFEISSDLKVAS